MNKKQPLVLAILDGFGLGEKNHGNAIHLANPHFINNLFETHGYSSLDASGAAVGLPDGQIGNSEVGHITIGSGRVVYQDLMKINNEIENGEFDKKFYYLLKSITNSRCHIFGLLSDGGVHSHENHAIHIIDLLLKNNIKVFCHFCLDGRDVGPTTGINSVKKIIEKFRQSDNFQLSTVIGRYFGMDRDKRWEKTKIAYDAILHGNGERIVDFVDAININYNNGVTDEFMAPMINEKYLGFEENDSLFAFNWRADRMRQIAEAIGNKDFSYFDNHNKYCNNFWTMAEYSEEISKYAKSLYKKDTINNSLGEIISQNNLKQLRIAETEKYAHVTFFFDGGIEKKIQNCDSILIQSDKSVKTYDLKPEMSANEIVDAMIEQSENYDVFIVNFANLDMVGHSGNIEATINAVKAIDNCVKKLYEQFVIRLNGTIILTSDHGNADDMLDFETNEIKTAHSLNKVPFCIVNSEKKFVLKDGSLSDIASTILHLLKIKKPDDMTGMNLIEKTLEA